MLNTSVNGKVQGLFKDFSRHLSVFSSTFQGKFNFQDSPVYSSTFQACAYPVKKTTFIVIVILRVNLLTDGKRKGRMDR